MRSLFSFPGRVNETSARLVAAGVIAQAIAFLVIRQGWLLVPLMYGFAARVLTGPTMSPLGQFVTRRATPFAERAFGVESRQVPGPPKRFAQGVGLVFSASAGVAWLMGSAVLSISMLGLLIVAATLESVFAVCLGCIAYNAIWGCDDCDDITTRLRFALADPGPVEAARVETRSTSV